jgi:hypothetical protein
MNIEIQKPQAINDTVQRLLALEPGEAFTLLQRSLCRRRRQQRARRRTRACSLGRSDRARTAGGGSDRGYRTRGRGDQRRAALHDH